MQREADLKRAQAYAIMYGIVGRHKTARVSRLTPMHGAGIGAIEIEGWPSPPLVSSLSRRARPTPDHSRSADQDSYTSDHLVEPSHRTNTASHCGP